MFEAQKLSDLLRLVCYCQPLDAPPEPEIGCTKVPVHFFNVYVSREAAKNNREEFMRILAGYPEPERFAQGISYIEAGDRIGDQGVALALFAVGEILEFWKVMTPESIGIEDPAKARDVAGMGFVYTTGYRP